jgi:serine/threonine protein kinase
MAQRRFQDLRLNTEAPTLSDHQRPYPTFSLGEDNDSTYGEEAIDGANEPSALADDDLVSSSGTEFAELREQFHRRGTAIAFTPTVRLDDGNQHDMGSPLPRGLTSNNTAQDVKSQPLEIPMKQRPRRYSDAERGNYDPITGAPYDNHRHDLHSYHRGEMRHPLLQSTVDELAKETSRLNVAGHIPSLTSETTASPVLEEIRTPVTGTEIRQLVSSPLEISPRLGSEMPSRRSVSQRSFGSLGSVGRRHTIKSAGSSLSSPARSYLSQWRSASQVREPDPDDEGQEIGDSNGPIYIIGRKIGFGGFSVVREATTLEGEKRVVRAVKIVRKHIKDISDTENEKVQQDFDREVDVWRYLRHKYILPLIAAYSTEFATFCITRLNRDGTLFDLVRARRRGPQTEWGLPSHLGKRYIYQLGSAIRYLHEDAHVVHRDIKPENCLLDMSAPDAEIVGGNILLCDFGMADWISNEGRSSSNGSYDHHQHHHHNTNADSPGGNVGPSQTSTAVDGSLEYVAPEMLAAGHPLYSTAADIWAYGCVMYTLLTGERPFTHEFAPRLAMMISRGSYDHVKLENAPAVQEHGGHGAIHLIEGCLELDPGQRMEIAQALDSEWLYGVQALYEESEFA